MTDKNDPAFPMLAPGSISVRDFFAAFALIGWRDSTASLSADIKSAYMIADAMLAEREKQ